MRLFYEETVKEGKDPCDAYLVYVMHEAENNKQWKRELETGFQKFQSVYIEIPKLELEHRGLITKPLNEEYFYNSLERILDRKDCADFVMPAFLRVLYRYRDSKLISEKLLKDIEDAVLGYKYWIDEPSEDKYQPCYFTENHQALFHTIELLAGQLFPDRIFKNNGKNGNWHIKHAKEHLDRWFDWRIRFGFSEWAANGYYGENLVAMISLMDFAEDENIKKKAQMLIDIILFEIALNSYKGTFGCSHGRAYNNAIMNPDFEATSAVGALLWGQGNISGRLGGGRVNKAAILMAADGYKVSKVIASIAKDRPQVMESFQRQSLNVEDGKHLGADPKDFNNIMLFWGNQTYDHRLVIDNSRKVCPDWYFMNDRVAAYIDKYSDFDRAGVYCDPDPDFTAMTQADMYTYKTPDYMLSCAQDFRKGKNGFQQHIWQATLGGKAIVYTNHPGSADYMDRPNYWAGNGVMPKAAAYKNVLICIYNTPADNTRFLISHAYFPQHEFDEILEKNGWIFGRKDKGYIGLHSMNKTEWADPDVALYKSIYGDNFEGEFSKAKPYELVSHGHDNVWVCEMGREDSYGSFQNFIDTICKSQLRGGVRDFQYTSPSQGKMEFGWDKPLKVEDEKVSLGNYPRFKNPYCNTEFNSKVYSIKNEEEELRLDFEKLTRQESK